MSAGQVVRVERREEVKPLRSLLIGDVDFYPSEFAFGVNQAMTRAGHWHTTVNIRQPFSVIEQRAKEVQPDVIWGHMLLWAPAANEDEKRPMHSGMTWKTASLLDLCVEARSKWKTKVLIHDGDARLETRCPVDLTPAVTLALCNHRTPRDPWKIPTLYWPYFAFDQDGLAPINLDLVCELAFAGRMGGGIYAERSIMVEGLKATLGPRMHVYPNETMPHTLYRTAELAVSAGAILGYGRPQNNGWLDVRTFQYPGAGGILLTDDTGGFLTPDEHYIAYQSGRHDSVLAALERLCSWEPIDRTALRVRAHKHVQNRHSATARVRQALDAVGITL